MNTNNKKKRQPLLPCPFCGGEVQDKPSLIPGLRGILCGSCGAVVSFRKSLDNPAPWWNRRIGAPY